MKNAPVIIVKKQGRGHHGHHGGAWKVAYADFVTAMMAFFLVMWIVAQNAATRQSVAAYFRDPGAFERTRQQGLLPGDAQGIAAAPTHVAEARAVLEQAAAELRRALERSPEFDALKDNVEITVTPEGLRIELLETATDGFFEVGSSTLREDGDKVLALIARQLQQLPNKIAVEGHTDSRPYQSARVFSNWELSSERANAARRAMQEHGLRKGQVDAVHGYADTRLRFKDDPLDARNRRVSILVRHDEGSSGAPSEGAGE